MLIPPENDYVADLVLVVGLLDIRGLWGEGKICDPENRPYSGLRWHTPLHQAHEPGPMPKRLHREGCMATKVLNEMDENHCQADRLLGGSENTIRYHKGY